MVGVRTTRDPHPVSLPLTLPLHRRQLRHDEEEASEAGGLDDNGDGEVHHCAGT